MFVSNGKSVVGGCGCSRHGEGLLSDSPCHVWVLRRFVATTCSFAKTFLDPGAVDVTAVPYLTQKSREYITIHSSCNFTAIITSLF